LRRTGLVLITADRPGLSRCRRSGRSLRHPEQPGINEGTPVDRFRAPPGLRGAGDQADPQRTGQTPLNRL